MYASAPDLLLVGTNTALCRSSDKGRRWRCDDSFSLVWSFAENGEGHLFAGTGDGVFRSTDRGVTWERILAQDQRVGAFQALVVNAQGHIFAGRNSIEGKVLYRSTDDGETWDLVVSGLTTNHVRALAVNRRGDLFAAGDNGIYRSMDNGDTWTQINNGLELIIEQHVILVFALKVDAQGNLWAGTQYGGGVYRSVDNGNTWNHMGLSEATIRTLSLNSAGDIFVGAATGVYRSNDAGESWQDANLPEHEGLGLSVDTEDYVFAGTLVTVYRSERPTVGQ